MTKDEIETELKRRFGERTYKYMDNTAYLTALADTVIGFVAEQAATKPCMYEPRELPNYLIPAATGSGASGMWCGTHGWDCPKAYSPVNK